MRGRRVASAAAAVALVTLTSLPTHVAHATAADPAGSAGRHCALTVRPVSAVPSAPDPAALTCFDTFSESIEFATKGRVRLAADATPESADAQLAASSAPLLGVEYDGTNYGGSSVAITGSSGRGCYDGQQYHINDMRDYGFNDRVSSAKLYSNCYATHYEHTSLRGDSYLCYPNCSSLGSMNNRTTSIRYF